MSNGIQKVQYNTEDRIGKQASVTIRAVNNLVLDGSREQIKQAFIDSGFSEGVERATLDGIIKGVTLGLSSDMVTLKSRELTEGYFLERKTYGTKLSEKLRKNTSNAITTTNNIVKKNLKRKTNWLKLADEISKSKAPIKGNISKKIEALAGEELRVIRKYGTKPDLKKINVQLRAAKRVADTISEKTPISRKLKAQYRRVIRAATSGNQELIKKELTKAIQRKMEYNSAMIARTELAEAHSLAFHRRINENPLIDGYKIILSSGHEIYDQCDFITTVDNGGGPGVYRKNDSPSTPIHTNCLCDYIPVVFKEGEKVKKYSKETAKKHLDNLPNKEKAFSVKRTKFKKDYESALRKKGVLPDSFPKREMLPKKIIDINENGTPYTADVKTI